jgi:hypothetical protein
MLKNHAKSAKIDHKQAMPRFAVWAQTPESNSTFHGLLDLQP